MHQTTKLRILFAAIIISVVSLVYWVLAIAFKETIKISEAPISEPRLQTYTVQGLTVQTTSTPDFFAVLAMVSLAKDQDERVAIMKEARITFNGPLNQFNQLLNPLELTVATSTLDTLDKAKAECEAAGASFAVYPMAREPGKTVVADCNIKAKLVFSKEF